MGRITALSFFGRRRGREPSEAAFPAGVPGERLVEVGRPDVRPEPVAEEELGVGSLPDEEVADPPLAAGPDDEVDLGRTAVPRAGERREEVRPLHRRPFREERDRREDRVAPRVVDGDPELHPLARRRERLCRPDRGDEARGEPVPPADHLQADAVLRAAARLAREEDEFKLTFYNTLTSWIAIDPLLALFGLDRAALSDADRVAAAVRTLAARMPTYVTLKDVKKRWGNGQEDIFPVLQWEKLWGDMTTLPEANTLFLAVPRQRGQQLKEQAQLDGWLRDGSAAYIENLCAWE